MIVDCSIDEHRGAKAASGIFEGRMVLLTAMRLAVLAIAAMVLGSGQATPRDDDRTADLLRELIRIDTSNPPGREGQIADLLAARFRPLGFDVDIVPTPETGKSHFIARLKGDASKRPVLLAAHADVVGVERDKWTVDPFGGILRDGYVYGRGAIDFKGGLAVFARAVMRLAEEKVPLARDVIFLAEADEESQPYNTTWLAERNWPKIDCEFALNEGGWIIKGDDGRVKYVSISTADKTSVGVVVTARGTSTHSSMPRPDSAILALAKALAKLADYDPKVQLMPITRQFLSTLAKTSAPPLAEHFRTLATSSDPAAIAAADAAVSRDPLIHAIIRNTIAPVMLNAGFRGNVIPGSAQATINVRVLPGTDPANVVRELEQAIGGPAIEVALARPSAGPVGTAPSSEDTALFRALAHHAHEVFPGAEVTPWLFQAGTDAGAWRTRGIPVYGIYPYAITAVELARMHGNDERVSVESLRQGTELIYRTILEVARR
jgi:acetylornithine deacetylase/succinyl-diaminopimelate desuccinylase-like protein